MDGNFSAEHMKMKNPQDDVSLADGHGFMVADERYKNHLRSAVDRREVGFTYTFDPITYQHSRVVEIDLQQSHCGEQSQCRAT